MSEQQVRQQYDAMAAWYDQYWQTYLRRTLAFLHAWVPLAPQQRVLDLACGTGIFAQMVLTAQPTQRIVGLDLSWQMLAVAQARCAAYPSVSFQQGRAAALPYAANRFEVVVSASAFHYFDDPPAVLAELRRVLTADGQLIILDWCKDFVLCRLFDILLQRTDPAHKQCYTQAELHALLAHAGFRVVAAQRQRFGLFWGLMVATSLPVRH